MAAYSAPDEARGASTCEPSALANLGPGVLWQGTERVGLKEVAALAAPVLWFPADEPLGYSVGGARFGVQALDWSRIDQLRFVWEIGAGAW